MLFFPWTQYFVLGKCPFNISANSFITQWRTRFSVVMFLFLSHHSVWKPDLIYTCFPRLSLTDLHFDRRGGKCQPASDCQIASSQSGGKGLLQGPRSLTNKEQWWVLKGVRGRWGQADWAVTIVATGKPSCVVLALGIQGNVLPGQPPGHPFPGSSVAGSGPTTRTRVITNNVFTVPTLNSSSGTVIY